MKVWTAAAIAAFALVLLGGARPARAEVCNYTRDWPVCLLVQPLHRVGTGLRIWEFGWGQWGAGCATVTARFYNADGSKHHDAQAFDSTNPKGPIPFCIATAGQRDLWYYRGFGDSAINDMLDGYVVVRVQFRSALTGRIHTLYASSDRLHSTPAAWSGGAGPFPFHKCADFAHSVSLITC